MATTRRSVSKTAPPTSKPQARSDALAKAGKGSAKGKQPVEPASKPTPAAKKATQAVAAAASAEATQDAQQGTLSPKQQLFALEYMTDLNATQAYLRAFPGVKASTAKVQGCRLLTNPNLLDFIAGERAKTASKLEITRERILLEAARLALFDPRKLFAKDGAPLSITELDDDTAAAIAGLEVLEEFEGSGDDKRLIGHVKKYKVADKNSALDKLMKHLGMFEKDNDQKSKGFGQALSDFAASLHARKAGRLPIAPAKAKDGGA